MITGAPTPNEGFYIAMRAAYIAITGYLVGYFGELRLNQEAQIRSLEANVQREQIARSLHDGYAQALAGVNLRLESARELFRRGLPREALAELAELQARVNREHDELRAYIRSLTDRDEAGSAARALDVATVAADGLQGVDRAGRAGAPHRA